MSEERLPQMKLGRKLYPCSAGDALAMTLLVEHVETLIAVAKEAEHLVPEAEWQIVESIEAEVAQVKAMAGRG